MTTEAWYLEDCSLEIPEAALLRAISSKEHKEFAIVVWQMESDALFEKDSPGCQHRANILLNALNLRDALSQLVNEIESEYEDTLNLSTLASAKNLLTELK